MIIAASYDLHDTVQWYNRALQYGDGLFETMRCQAGNIPLWSLHRNRMSAGLSKLGMDDLNWSDISNHVKKIQTPNCLVKLLVFRGGHERGYQTKTSESHWLISMHHLSIESKTQPLRLAVAQGQLSKQPLLAGMKHLNRLEQVLIARELNQMSGVDDLLVLDQQRRVVETTCRNVVLIKDNHLITPHLKDCGVKGVALSWLKAHFQLETKHVKIESMNDFDGLMAGNSIRGFQLVESVKNEHKIHSFLTNHAIHDKISRRWELMFGS